ncbi:MAG: hypothetical protein Q9207_000977 [Kuettlingeria erythrocarpa]
MKGAPEVFLQKIIDHHMTNAKQSATIPPSRFGEAMDQAQLPAVTTIPHLSTDERAAVLDRLFEPCVPLHTLSAGLLREKSFDSYDDLISSIGLQLTNLADSPSTNDMAWLESILAAHPRLGRKVESRQSQAEQAQLNSPDDPAGQSLSELNDLYEQTFPGLRYVVFVNGRERATITKDMKSRIERRDPAAERKAAIKAMCEIAADRARNAGTEDDIT